MGGQPWLTILATTLPASKPSWTTVSLTTSPCSSISNVTFERGSAATRPPPSSLPPPAPPPHLAAQPERLVELGRERVPRVRQPTVGLGHEHDLLGVRARQAALMP